MSAVSRPMGITGLSKSQVSEMAKDLDAHVEEFRTRSLAEADPFTFVAADALVLKVREGGRVVPVHALVAIGVNAAALMTRTPRESRRPGHHQRGRRRLAGLLPGSDRPRLSGVKLVTSDAHAGLVAAISATLPRAGRRREFVRVDLLDIAQHLAPEARRGRPGRSRR